MLRRNSRMIEDRRDSRANRNFYRFGMAMIIRSPRPACILPHCLIAIIFACVSLSCSKNARDEGAAPGGFRSGPDMALAKKGYAIFRDKSFGKTGIACSDCHADYPDSLQPPERILAGHSILGAQERAEAWNGEFTGPALKSTAAGAARCASMFQARAATPAEALTADEAAALMAFYTAVSPGAEAKRLPWTAVARPGDKSFSKDSFEANIEAIDKPTGDAEKGATQFEAACRSCHGRDEGGIRPSLRSLRRSMGMLSRVVRIGYKTMPFFARDKLTDRDIADIREFLDRAGR
jgi:mono/diheme cytochrome c family protein